MTALALTASQEATAPRDEEPAAEGPLRRCLATRAVRPKAELLRFVVGPGDLLVPDIAGRLPGRGLWITPVRDIVAGAAARNLFAKAAKARVVVPPDLVDRVEGLLARDLLDRLGLARRAGQVVAGFEQVRALLAEGGAGLLLAAADGAEDGRRKLRGVAAGVPLVDWLTAAELAAALGRDTVVHAAVRRGVFAERLAAAAARLQGMRDRARQLTD
jgi:predicted RNA-binding protein YlxR (DUF448 family)